MRKQKTVKMLIIESIKSGKRPQSLNRIYDKVKKFRPETSETTIRGRINESILKNENLFKVSAHPRCISPRQNIK